MSGRGKKNRAEKIVEKKEKGGHPIENDLEAAVGDHPIYARCVLPVKLLGAR
jgi:hypothetical protein